MSDYTDPETIIIAAPAGSAIYGRVSIDGAPMRTVLMIREDDARINALGSAPAIRLKFATFDAGAVVPAVLMIGIAGGELYETWWNYHQPGGIGATHFADMSTQADVPVLFYDARGRRRAITVRNRLQRAFANATAQIEALPAWSMQDFDTAREGVYARYPDVRDLWRAIG
jgi:hypothetical protein